MEIDSKEKEANRGPLSLGLRLREPLSTAYCTSEEGRFSSLDLVAHEQFASVLKLGVKKAERS